ncbi:MAG TPA: acetyl-CoA carboxylase, carboxyltransferase subunit beta [Planctomycetota bacterium]|nr:acetyl-CoA carboxylase, carboxyltransferase subunit beta [Planctomycetota bacterium]
MAWDGFSLRRKKEMPQGLFIKCPDCGNMVYRKTVAERLQVCPECNYHFTLSGEERIKLLLDDGVFAERYGDMTSADPLHFKDRKTYVERLAAEQKKTGLREAATVGTGRMGGHDIVFGVTDSRFIMGSMASVVGEKVTRAIELAIETKRPLVIVSGSGGGARMHEGVLSLSQMAKTSAALARLDDAGGLFISVLTNPTMGGVAASFASLGDVVIAEPKALVGFAGPRTIWHTLKIELPEGFQSSEFLLEHGFIDMIVNRSDLKKEIVHLLDYFDRTHEVPAPDKAETAGEAPEAPTETPAGNADEAERNPEKDSE